jgi:hypothetical protein
LPGSAHQGIAKRLLERYEWWRFEPHQEWVTPKADESDRFGPYAAGIPGEARIVYSFRANYPWLRLGHRKRIDGIEPGSRYRAFFVDPRTGVEHVIGLVDPDKDGIWPIPMEPTTEDWVTVLQRV